MRWKRSNFVLISVKSYEARLGHKGSSFSQRAIWVRMMALAANTPYHNCYVIVWTAMQQFLSNITRTHIEDILKGSNLKFELDYLHGQATVLAALVSISPKLPLGYPARLPRSVLEVSKKMLTESSWNPMVVTVEQEGGWLLLSSLLASMPKEELEDQVFDILSLWAALFIGDAENQIKQTEDLTSSIWLPKH